MLADQEGSEMAKKSDRGYTMIIVMCLMFLFMALALSMLFSSAQTLARAQREAARKQSRATAVSFAEWMDKQLKVTPVVDPSNTKPNNLTGWIQKKLTVDKSWHAYTGEFGGEADVAILTYRPETTKETATSGWKEEELGQVEVEMYWETEDGGTDPTAEDVNLVVTVKAVVRGEQFSVTTRYAKDVTDSGEWKDGTWNMRGRE